jgi:hypothetical protein
VGSDLCIRDSTYPGRARTGGNGYSPSGFLANGSGNPIAAYIPGGYGQRRPGGLLQPLSLAEGQAVIDLVVPLWRGGTISGTVFDDTGEAVVDAVVGAVRVSSDGRLMDGPTARTDDRGMYRLSGLVPGRYVVFVPQTTTAMSAESADMAMQKIVELRTAQNPGAPVAPVPDLTGIRVGSALVKTASTGLIDGNLVPRRAGEALFVFQTTFHPSAVALASAAPVEIEGGDDRTAIDVALAPVRAAAASGTVLAGGSPASGVRLRLVPSSASPDAALFDAAVSQTDALGRFTFPLVPVGNYILKASNDPRPPRAVALRTPQQASTDGGPGAWLSEDVGVGPEGVNGLAFTMRAGLTVRGQIEFTGASPRPSDEELSRGQFALELRPTQPSSRSLQAGISPQAIPIAGGIFSLVGIPPGRYVLRLSMVPRGPQWRIQSVVVGGRESNDVPIDLSEDTNDVRVVLTDKSATVAGTVSAANPGDADASVLLFPADRSLWPEARAMARRFRTARPGTDGTFAMSDVPPGDYLVVAVADVAVANWPDTKFVTALAPLANSLRVEPGSRSSLSLLVKTVARQP